MSNNHTKKKNKKKDNPFRDSDDESAPQKPPPPQQELPPQQGPLLPDIQEEQQKQIPAATIPTKAAGGPAVDTSTDSPSAKRQGKIDFAPLKKKPKVVPVAFSSTPRKFKSPDKQTTRAITVVQTRDGCLLAEISTTEGKPCYNKHLTDFVNEDPHRAASEHAINATSVARHKLDPNDVWKEVVQYRGREITKMRNLYININFRGNKSKEYRNNWGLHMVQLHNSPKFQKQLFGNNNRAFYAGDLTPTSDDPPYLSEFLTIRNTINIIGSSFDRALGELIASDAVLEQYFPRSMFQQVREFYRDRYRNSYDDRMPHESDCEDESDIPKFEP